MKLKTKNKIIAVLILSVLVLGGASAYLHHQYMQLSENADAFLLIEGENLAKPEIIISPIEFEGSTKHRSRLTSEAEELVPSVGVSINNGALSGTAQSGYSPRNSSVQRQSSSTSNIRGNDGHQQLYSGGGGGMLLASGGSRSAGVSATGGSGIGVTSNQPSFVPFTGTVNNSQALVDPGVETRMIKITPVGDSIWLLLLLAAGYLGFRKLVYSK